MKIEGIRAIKDAKIAKMINCEKMVIKQCSENREQENKMLRCHTEESNVSHLKPPCTFLLAIHRTQGRGDTYLLHHALFF